MARLNNKTYNNWLDYITAKFPANQFSIAVKAIPEEKTDTITAKIGVRQRPTPARRIVI